MRDDVGMRDDVQVGGRRLTSPGRGGQSQGEADGDGQPHGMLEGRKGQMICVYIREEGLGEMKGAVNPHFAESKWRALVTCAAVAVGAPIEQERIISEAPRAVAAR